MRNFQPYNKEVLFKIIDKISITKQGEQVITKYGDRVIKVANVSNRYEIFDIAKYLKDKIETIEKNFEISKYRLSSFTKYYYEKKRYKRIYSARCDSRKN